MTNIDTSIDTQLIKLHDVIQSCTNAEQLQVADNFANVVFNNAVNAFKQDLDAEDLIGRSYKVLREIEEHFVAKRKELGIL